MIINHGCIIIIVILRNLSITCKQWNRLINMIIMMMFDYVFINLSFGYHKIQCNFFLFSINIVLTKFQINLLQTWLPFSLMFPSLCFHNHVSSHVEAKAIEKITLPFPKYNVPNFLPFSITSAPLMTLHVLYINVVIHPSLPNCPIKIRFFLRSITCSTSFRIHWFPFYSFICALPFPTMLQGLSSPKQICPKSPWT